LALADLDELVIDIDERAPRWVANAVLDHFDWLLSR